MPPRYNPDPAKDLRPRVADDTPIRFATNGSHVTDAWRTVEMFVPTTSMTLSSPTISRLVSAGLHTGGEFIARAMVPGPRFR